MAGKISQFRGMLLGLAVGDAMGYTVDSSTWKEIQENYGPNGLLGYDLVNGYAEVTSYTQLAVFTCNGLLLGLTRGQMTGKMLPLYRYAGLSSREWAASQKPWGRPSTTFCWLLQQPEICRRHCMDTRMLDALSRDTLGAMEARFNGSTTPGSLTSAAAAGLFSHLYRVEQQERDCTSMDGKSYRGFGLYVTGALVASDSVGTWLRYVWYQTVDYVQLVWFSLRQLVTGGASMDDVGGPVAIVSTITDVGMESQQQAEAHDLNGTVAAIRSIASFAALIAVNLAVMNLLPIPALDGGHILFLILDTLAAKLFRRRIPAKYENAISSVFLVALMGFMLFVTAHDIFKLIR